jgi:hypothetical protein
MQKLHDEYLFLPGCDVIKFESGSITAADVSDAVKGDKVPIYAFPVGAETKLLWLQLL